MSNYAIINPSTGDLIATYPTATNEAIADSISAALTAFSTWSNRSFTERAAVLEKVADLYMTRRDTLADLIVQEMGKPRNQALDEIDFCSDIYRFYAHNGERFLADEYIECSRPGTAFIRKTAIGPLLGIMPWNFPCYQVARFAAPNLMAGNTILLKPAPQCPGTAEAMAQLFIDALLDEGAFIPILATNEQIEEVIAHPAIRGVSLTGSERAGSAVAIQAGRHLKKVVLELGGSDPFIVLSRGDLDETVAAAVSARLGNNGQTCNAAKRFLIIDDLYDDFVARFTAALHTFTPTSPDNDDCQLGPLSSLGAAEILRAQIRSAIDQGATALLEDPGHTGAFISPVILADITPDNSAFTEEFFGPVAQVYRIHSEDEAVKIANATPYGLGAFIFTEDHDQALRVADRLDAGMVYINEVDADAPELPFGGVKNSGFGRELGRAGITEFINAKLIRSAT